jgi:hypothetical protein
MPSPAEILRSCLLDAAAPLVLLPEDHLGQTPGGELLVVQQPQSISDLVTQQPVTPCYVSSVSDDIDQVVALYDVPGRIFGRSMTDGQYWFHLGIKAIIRHLDYSAGWDLSQQLAAGFDAIQNHITTLNGVQHRVNNVYRLGTIHALGEEVGKRRQLFSIDARIVLASTEPPLG